MNLNSFVNGNLETPDSFFARSFWDSANDRVIVWKQPKDRGTAVEPVEVLTVEQARNRIDILESAHPTARYAQERAILQPEPHCRHPELIFIEEVDAHTGEASVFRWECSTCGKSVHRIELHQTVNWEEFKEEAEP